MYYEHLTTTEMKAAGSLFNSVTIKIEIIQGRLLGTIHNL